MAMNIIELVIDEDQDSVGVEAVSVVENPAIEVDFIALNKTQVQFKVMAEKRILLGPALIPNKQIYREDDINGQFYIWFSKDTVRKASELFFKNHNQSNATYEHLNEIKEMTVVESWIIEDSKKDKSSLYNFNLPRGTWMMSMKVDNDEVWEKVKLGKIKGFSIEGYFADKLQMKKVPEQNKIDQIKNIIKEWEKSL